VIVNKMGSLQKAVKALLAVLDDTMLDRWIPDEDWVHQTQESGENDCFVRNLNSGLAKECAWQNNHAILQGQILFYNKKSIRIKKTEGTATKNIRLYYVLSPRKPAPTVPSVQHAAADSCGLHDLQSAFRPALQHFVGVGGLESCNAIQLLHTMFALYKDLKKGWKKIVRAVWKKVRGKETMPENLVDTEDAPNDVTQAMQEPLVTRWWTIGSLAQFASMKYVEFFLLMAKACCNITKTDQKENIITSNLLSLASSDWIRADIYLIAG
jgi:hypothetical protein